MENDIRRLEKELKDAKRREFLSDQNERLEKVKKAYLGKCFGTHKFVQNSKAQYRSAIRIIDIYRNSDSPKGVHCMGGDDDVTLRYLKINSSRNKEPSGNFTMHYERRELSRIIESETEKMENFAFNMLYRMKEIPLEKFQQLWKSFEDAEPIIETAFSTMPLEMEKSIGNHGNQSEFAKNAQSMGLELIDLEKDDELFQIFKWKNYPGIFQDRFMMKGLMQSILQTQILREREDMASPWSDYRRINACEGRIKVLEKYLEQFQKQ